MDEQTRKYVTAQDADPFGHIRDVIERRRKGEKIKGYDIICTENAAFMLAYVDEWRKRQEIVQSRADERMAAVIGLLSSIDELMKLEAYKEAQSGLEGIIQQLRHLK